MTTLATVQWLSDAFAKHALTYWLFGGFAVDFHVGQHTRPHDDVDVAVLQEDFARAEALLVSHGWTRLPSDEAGYATFERSGARIDLAPIERNDAGWPAGAFGDDIRELDGVRARVVTRAALVLDKSEQREEFATRAKDAADLRALTRT